MKDSMGIRLIVPVMWSIEWWLSQMRERWKMKLIMLILKSGQLSEKITKKTKLSNSSNKQNACSKTALSKKILI